MYTRYTFLYDWLHRCHPSAFSPAALMYRLILSLIRPSVGSPQAGSPLDMSSSSPHELCTVMLLEKALQ